MTEEFVTLESKLIELAAETVNGLKAAVEGKAELEITKARSGALSKIATTIDALMTAVEHRRRDQDLLERALRRIADLKIRGGTELLEQGNWKKIASELQAIAEDALQPKRTDRPLPQGASGPTKSPDGRVNPR